MNQHLVKLKRGMIVFHILVDCFQIIWDLGDLLDRAIFVNNIIFQNDRADRNFKDLSIRLKGREEKLQSRGLTCCCRPCLEVPADRRAVLAIRSGVRMSSTGATVRELRCRGSSPLLRPFCAGGHAFSGD